MKKDILKKWVIGVVLRVVITVGVALTFSIEVGNAAITNQIDVDVDVTVNVTINPKQTTVNAESGSSVTINQ